MVYLLTQWKHSVTALALLGLLVGVGSFASAAGADKANAKDQKSAVESVEMFQAIEQGQIEVKFIPRNIKEGKIFVKNLTNKPLNVNVPEVMGASPVLAQNLGGGGGGGNSDQGGLQSIMGSMDSGGGGGGGGVFNVPPEKIIEKKLETVCLEYGKKDPTPHVPYTIKKIDELTDRPAVKELGRLLGDHKVDNKTIQLAAWMLNNDKTVQDLSKETWTHAGGRKTPAHSPAELAAAANLARLAMQSAENRAAAEAAPASDSVGNSSN